MRKKYLSALLFGALLVASAGTFTSCKDYDDDINNLQEQIDKVVADLADLAEQIKNSGKGVTSVTFNEETGVLTVVTDGQTATYTVKTEATGSVNIEIKDGHLFVDGVDKGEVSGSKVTVVDGVLNIDGEPAGLEVGNKVAIVKGNGVYLLTVDGETVELPMAGISLSYIDVINADQYGIAFEALYDINDKDVEYGPEGNKKTLKAGLYTTLDRDLKIVVNPQSADASLFNFSLKNSAGDDTELTFKTAKPYEGTLSVYDVTSRAASSNGIWVLENDYTRYDNNNLTDVRTDLYTKFKANDGDPHALTLEAANAATTFNTPYNLSAQLRQMKSGKVGAFTSQYKMINEWNVPTNWVIDNADESSVYDYWLTLEQSPLNLQKAQIYGVEISEDGHSFRFTKEAGIGNEIQFVYNYILVNGTIYQGQTGDNQGAIFTASFSQETATITEEVFADMVKPFDADKITDPAKQLLSTIYIANINSKLSADDFGMVATYDFSGFYNGLSDANKLVWNSAIAEGTLDFNLIGGEGDNNDDNLNWYLLSNIRYAIDNTNKEIKLQFLVDKDAYTNFKLNNAYQLEITVKDPIANNIVASLKFPFELQQPTLDITRVNGEKAIWASETELRVYGDKVVKDDVPYMYAPLYEAFTTAYAKQYSEFVPGAEYYKLSCNIIDPLHERGYWAHTIIGNEYQDLNASLNDITYSATAEKWNTYTANMYAIQEGVGIPIHAEYKFYGVYPATKEQVKDFTLRFSSLLGDAKTVKANSEFTSTTVTREVILTDKDFTLVDALGDQFYLFDGVKDDGNIIKRSELNSNQKFEEGTEGFALDFILQNANIKVKDANGEEISISVDRGTVHEGTLQADDKGEVTFTDGSGANVAFYENSATKTRGWIANTAPTENIVVTNLDAKQADKAKGYAAIPGGIMIQLPSSIGTTEPVTIEFELVDVFGVTKTLSVTVKAAK